MIRDNKNHNTTVKPNTRFLEEMREKLPDFFIADKNP